MSTRTDKDRATRRKRRQSPEVKKRKLQEQLRRIARHTKILRDIKESGSCADCGGRFPAECMDFDHRDRTQKHLKPSLLRTRSLTKIRTELAKCDLVCANCHRIRTSARRDYVPLGKLASDRKYAAAQLGLDLDTKERS